jgi:signal transduction histidine kinase
MLLTSLSAPEDIIRGLECGADNFVVKPYEPEFLLSRIETILTNQELRGAIEPRSELPIFFAGKQYVVTSDRWQILNLLLSTYETAVKTNHELIQTHEALKAAQGQLIEVEKLRSVDRLAAGVAHEVRNPLAILEMGITFLSEKHSGADEKKILAEMREAVRRAGLVVSGLMNIAPDELEMREVDIKEVVDRALAVFAHQLSEEGIAVHMEAMSLPCRCRLDAGKMEQVFLNIFSNARDAMPGGGVLTVRAEVRGLQRSEAIYDAGDRSGSRLREGDQAVVVEITDTGSGIPAENFDKIFDPFFSTKPTGKGTGLGLTVAKKIVHLHGGRISITPIEAGGTQARVIMKCAVPNPSNV